MDGVPKESQGRPRARSCEPSVLISTHSHSAASGRTTTKAFLSALVGGHGKLPGDGHESARWRS